MCRCDVSSPVLFADRWRLRRLSFLATLLVLLLPRISACVSTRSTDAVSQNMAPSQLAVSRYTHWYQEAVNGVRPYICTYVLVGRRCGRELAVDCRLLKSGHSVRLLDSQGWSAWMQGCRRLGKTYQRTPDFALGCARCSSLYLDHRCFFFSLQIHSHTEALVQLALTSLTPFRPVSLLDSFSLVKSLLNRLHEFLPAH